MCIYQTSHFLFSNSYTIIFLFCIDTFFIYALHLSTIALSHLSIIHTSQSCTTSDILHLCIALTTHSCVVLITYLCIALISHLYVALISHSCITLISHSYDAFFHYVCIIYTAPLSLVCFLPSSYNNSSFYLFNKEMQVNRYKALILPHRCLFFSLVSNSLNVYFVSLFLYKG